LNSRVSAEPMRQKILASESGTVRKQGYHRLKVALASMTPYALAMNNLGFQTVYRLFNEHPEARCERIFCLDPNRAGRTESWLALESGARLQDFDVLAVSLSYEQDCLRLPAFLKSAGVPLYAAERWGGLPLVFCGGTVITANPEPVAPFIDVCGIGDAEILVRNFIRTWLEGREKNWDRERLLLELAAAPGFYVPSLYEPDAEGRLSPALSGSGRQQVPAALEKQTASMKEGPAHSVVVSGSTHFAGMYLVEVARGCRWKCRFCLICSINRPYRPLEATEVIRLLESRPAAARSVGLVGANLCDHPELESILNSIAGMGLRLGASSLRTDTLDEAILQALRACKVRTVTLAPEAAGAGLLAAIGKRCRPDQLRELTSRVGKAGFARLKLYYMIGLPGEEAGDRQALVEQVKELRALLPDELQLKISLNPFIPKPQTPLQDEPMAEVSLIKAAIRQVRRGLAAGKGSGIQLQVGAVAESLTQAAISLGDRRLAAAIERACLKGERFLDALAAAGVDSAELLHRRKNPAAPRPWRMLETKV